MGSVAGLGSGGCGLGRFCSVAAEKFRGCRFYYPFGCRFCYPVGEHRELQSGARRFTKRDREISAAQGQLPEAVGRLPESAERVRPERACRRRAEHTGGRTHAGDAKHGKHAGARLSPGAISKPGLPAILIARSGPSAPRAKLPPRPQSHSGCAGGLSSGDREPGGGGGPPVCREMTPDW